MSGEAALPELTESTIQKRNQSGTRYRVTPSAKFKIS